MKLLYILPCPDAGECGEPASMGEMILFSLLILGLAYGLYRLARKYFRSNE